MKLKLQEPTIIDDHWEYYNTRRQYKAKMTNLVGYTQEQVDNIVLELKNELIKARETFDQLSKLGNGDYDGNSIGNTIAQAARAKIDRLFE